jgi:hypothetical protein
MTQRETVLKHLEHRGSISPMEALVSYGIYRLSANIHLLREDGYGIYTEYKTDEAGHRYARYNYVYDNRGKPVYRA